MLSAVVAFRPAWVRVAVLELKYDVSGSFTQAKANDIQLLKAVHLQPATGLHSC